MKKLIKTASLVALGLMTMGNLQASEETLNTSVVPGNNTGTITLGKNESFNLNGTTLENYGKLEFGEGCQIRPGTITMHPGSELIINGPTQLWATITVKKGATLNEETEKLLEIMEGGKITRED